MRSDNPYNHFPNPGTGEYTPVDSSDSPGTGSAAGASKSGVPTANGSSAPSGKKGMGRAGIAATVILLVLAIVAGVQLEKNSVVRDVRFTGNYFTGTDELTAVIPFQTGIPADSVNFVSVMDRVNSLPYIRSSDIYLEANGLMVVDVRERTPAALLISANGRSYIDGEGVFLPIVLNKPVDVPLLYGYPISSGGDTLAAESFLQVRRFLNEIRANNFAWVTISEITYNEHEGVVALNHENGVKLIFGDDDYQKKLKAWEVFYSDVVSSRGIESFSYVDLRFRNQIITHEL